MKIRNRIPIFNARTRIVRGVLTILLFACFLAVSGQQYSYRLFDTEHGMPHSEVSSIIQDQNDNMWFSTYGGGVARYNGAEYKVFNEVGGLSSNLCREVVQDNDGVIWVATMGGGVSCIDHDSIYFFGDTVVGLNDRVYSLEVDHLGAVWMGTDDGVFVYKDDSLKHYTDSTGLKKTSAIRMFEDSKNRMWLCMWGYGLAYYENEEFIFVDTSMGLANNNVLSIQEDESGTLWVGTFTGTNIITFEGGKPVVKTPKESLGLPEDIVYGVVEDQFGDHWFATGEHGIFHQRKSDGRLVNQGNRTAGLESDVGFFLFKDREENIWASLWGAGVVMYAPPRFVHYTEKNIANKIVNDILFDGERTLFGTSAGVVEYKDHAFSPVLKNLKGNCTAILKDSKGGTWYGYAGGVKYDQPNGQQRYYSKEEFPWLPIRAIEEDRHGNIWFCSWSTGIVKYNGTEFVTPDREEVPESAFYTIFKDSKKNLWFGSWGGYAYKYNGDVFRKVGEKEGAKGQHVSCFTEDSLGNIWMGSYGGGIAIYNGRTVRHFNQDSGLADNGVLAVHIDRNNEVWVATIKGIDRFKLSDFYNRTLQVTHYGRDEGFQGVECVFNGIHEGPNGDLWFGTKHMLTLYQGQYDVNQSVRPKVIIESAGLFHKTEHGSYAWRSALRGEGKLSLQPEDNSIVITYSAFTSTQNVEMLYSTRLVGQDEKWSPWLDRREAIYRNLDPGTYHFEVRAKGSELSEVSMFEFEVLPPFWRTKWFYALSVIFIVFCAYSLLKWRESRLVKTKEKLENEVEKRTEEINEQRLTIERKNKNIIDSINYAQRIQQNMLPAPQLMTEHAAEHFVTFMPKDIVSGDFYWIEKVGNKRLFAVIDCTGHGVPGAMVSVMAHNGLNRCVKEFKLSEPAAILDQLNRLVEETFEKGASDVKDGMDIAICAIDGKVVEFAGAYNPLWVISESSDLKSPKMEVGNRKLFEFKGDKQPIGANENVKPFTNHKVELQTGDELFMFSDGYVDQFGGTKGKKFKSKAFKQLLLEQDVPFNDRGQVLEDRLNVWRGPLEQVDDVCVLGIKL